MGVGTSNRRLIVNADDFGRSTSINEAVVRAHREGILTTASLMVNEPSAAEAVRLARENPCLGVGLHLVLLCGQSALGPGEIPGLVDSRARFSDRPVAAGFRYFFGRRQRDQLRREVRAQLAAFARTGLECDHVNGHLHMHLHPAVFRILEDLAPEFGIKRVRLTRDPLRLNLRLASGALAYRVSHALIFGRLAARARSRLEALEVRFTERVFGLLQNARVDEAYVLGLLARLPGGDSELYSHPSLAEFKHEFDALVSPRVSTAVREHGIQLIRYLDL